MHVRSYARALPGDRRIYRIDRWAIPVPGGLPLAASAWFLILALAVGAIGQLPGLNAVVGVVGWPAAVIVAPGAGAVLLIRRCDDGRTLPKLAAHRVGFAHRQRRCASLPLPERLHTAMLVAADISMHGRSIVRGPGRVLLASTAQLQVTRAGIRVRSGDTATQFSPAVLALGVGEWIQVRL